MLFSSPIVRIVVVVVVVVVVVIRCIRVTNIDQPTHWQRTG
jgi:hypothetical protein